MTVFDLFRGRACVSPAEAGTAIFGWQPSTCYNRIFAGTFPLPLVEIGGKKMVRVSDIAVALGEPPTQTPAANVSVPETRRSRGRPRKVGIRGAGK